MDQETQNIITNQLSKLPVEVKDAITAVDYPRKLEVITKSNKLLIDQAGKLETETTLVMLGLESLNDYVENLTRELQIPKDKAMTIARDADELIFKNIRESLKKVTEKTETAQAATDANIIQKPTKEAMISAIENPETIPTKINMLLEIAPEIQVPSLRSPFEKAKEAYHANVSPVENIVQAKMTEKVIVPKENIVVEEKVKLPEKQKPASGGDPYREPIN